MSAGGPVAVAMTMKNEGASLSRLLAALQAQSVPPAEVVVADGGSDPRTAALIEGAARAGQPVRLVPAAGACRGRGRNLAISATHAPLVALIDGGCLPEPDWLERLLAQLHGSPGCQAVFGVVRPETDTRFAECVAIVVATAQRLPDGRRAMSPSVASLLLRREVWEQVGGFPEDLRTGEDLIFLERIRRGGFRIELAPEAVVHWKAPRTLRGLLRRTARYSEYGLEAGLGHTWHSRVLVYDAVAAGLVALGAAGAPWAFALLGVLLVARAVRTVARNDLTGRRGVGRFAPRRVLLVAWLLLVIDAATLAGVARWLWRRCPRREPRGMDLLTAR
jgi:cellulose synthase/poly-beta-1,6-N-acetylglucosamine synthase-like glycosyltransferase